MAGKKFYVVWQGRETGVFDCWEDCKRSVEGFQEAKYKSFKNPELAEKAFREGAQEYWGKALREPSTLDPHTLRAIGKPIENSISVDAACSSRSGEMEYQGVYTGVRQLLFTNGPFRGGSNNIGEFLALVHALAWCKKHRIKLPVYTDSRTAMAWLRNKKARTRIQPGPDNQALFDLIRRAEKWLRENHWDNAVLKWETEAWGEIPADFGRK